MLRKFAVVFCIILLSSEAFALELWNDHVEPTLEKGFDTNGIYILAGGLALSGLMQEQDQTNLRAVQNSVDLDGSQDDFGDFAGTGVLGLMIAGGQYLLDDQSEAVAHVETIMYTGFSVAIMKAVFNRSRPNNGQHSWPSGHTSTMFATATSLTYSYGWKAAVVAYPIALLTALQRMDSNYHWPSDLVAGATMGIFWARAVSGHKLNNLTPVVTARGLRLYYRLSF